MVGAFTSIVVCVVTPDFLSTIRYLFAQLVAGQVIVAEFCVMALTVCELTLGHTLLLTVAVVAAVHPFTPVTVRL